MTYGKYTLEAALKTYALHRIHERDEPERYKNFMSEFALEKAFTRSQIFQEEFNFSMEEYETTDAHSEESMKAYFIWPILREIWRHHNKKLRIWHAKELDADAEQGLTGEPDYYVTRRSGIPEAPYCIIVEAKKIDFEKGWGQALSGMKGAQLLNEKEKGVEIPIYGIVSTGVLWQFGKFFKEQFALFPLTYLNVVKSDEELSQVLNHIEIIFGECEKIVDLKEY